MEPDENKKKIVIEQLTAVHIYFIKQKNDDEDKLTIYEHENILFSSYFMSGRRDPDLTDSEILLWLSVWRTGFELCDQLKLIPEWKLKHLFSALRNYLLDSNKYVVYETQRVYVAVLHKLKLQFVLEDIASSLKSTSKESLGTVVIYAEICRDILSRHNPHAVSIFDDLSQPLLTFVSGLFQNRSHVKFYDCLNQLTLILLKVVKLIVIYQHENASKFIIKVLNTHGKKLVDIIFDCFVQNGFIWTKVCQMWFRILNLLDLKGFESRKGILRHFASAIIDKMHQFGVLILFPGNIQTLKGHQPKLGFTGSCLPKEKACREIHFDCVRLAEGCLLTLKACECLIVRPGDGTEAKLSLTKSYTVLLSLDTFVKEVLSCDNKVLFHWLPQVLGNQDDSWIEALLMLLKIAPLGKLSDTRQDYQLHHHLYFHQFLATTGYDHSVLVDLLTSPETCFLTYFTKYLKYSLSGWENFLEGQKFCAELLAEGLLKSGIKNMVKDDTLVDEHIQNKIKNTKYDEKSVEKTNESDRKIHEMTCYSTSLTKMTEKDVKLDVNDHQSEKNDDGFDEAASLKDKVKTEFDTKLLQSNAEIAQASFTCPNKRKLESLENDGSMKRLKSPQNTESYKELSKEQITPCEAEICHLTETEIVETSVVEGESDIHEKTNPDLESLEIIEEEHSDETFTGSLLSENSQQTVLLSEKDETGIVNQADYHTDTSVLPDTCRNTDDFYAGGDENNDKTVASDSVKYQCDKDSSQIKERASFENSSIDELSDNSVIKQTNNIVITNELDMVEFVEETKLFETQRLETGHCKDEKLILTENCEFVSTDSDNESDKIDSENCSNLEKLDNITESSASNTTWANAIDEDFDNIEFQENENVASMDSKLVHYEIDDEEYSSNQSGPSIEDLGNEDKKNHHKHDLELDENSECQIDDIDYEIEEISERTSDETGLVDYVISDEDVEMILDTGSEMNCLSSVVISFQESTEFKRTDKSSDLLDKLMGVLIRVRMKLEKLKSASILQYNPQPLLKLLTALEDRYESL